MCWRQNAGFRGLQSILQAKIAFSKSRETRVQVRRAYQLGSTERENFPRAPREPLKKRRQYPDPDSPASGSNNVRSSADKAASGETGATLRKSAARPKSLSSPTLPNRPSLPSHL